MRSISAGEELASTLPWADVVIDVQGPFTRSEEGHQYVLSYHCVKLRVPKIVSFKSLQPGYFSRALVECVMRAGSMPDVVRSDRGPEMKNAIMKELTSIGMDATRLFGAAFTPRHQGMGERGHALMAIHHNILMNAVCQAFPQEWPALLPAVELSLIHI